MAYIVDIRYSDKATFIKYLAYHLHDQPHVSEFERFYAQCDDDDTNQTSLLTPWIGSHDWEYKGATIKIHIREEGKPAYCGLGIDYYQRIQLQHDDLELLSSFIKEALAYTTPIKEQQIKIFYAKSKGYWEHFHNIHVQTLDKIYLDPTVKSAITYHIDRFVANKERYIKFGRPYKLNFLLTGVPGAGKTSLIKAIALRYNRPIYVLSFSRNFTDETLVQLMSEVKNNSIILMEDIDAFFVDRESQSNINVSFSALLNVMDGTIMKGNGTMMFLTANNTDRLDPALIRPGRIDHVVKFDYPRQQEIKTAFKDITEIDDDTVFTTFYKNIKTLKLNMSTIIDFLFRYSDNFMEHIDELLAQNRIREEIANDKCKKMYM